MNNELTTSELYRILDEAAILIDRAASGIQTLPLEPKHDHTLRLASALGAIFDVQYHLFALEPSLTPLPMKDPFEQLEQAWGTAHKFAMKARKSGHPEMAISIYKWFQAQTNSATYRKRSQRQIDRLKNA